MKKQKYGKFGKSKNKSKKSLNILMASALGLSVMFSTPAMAQLSSSMPIIRAQQEQSQVVKPVNFLNDTAQSQSSKATSKKQASTASKDALSVGATTEGAAVGGSAGLVTGATESNVAKNTGATVSGEGLSSESSLAKGDTEATSTELRDFWGRDEFYTLDSATGAYTIKTFAQLCALGAAEGNFYKLADQGDGSKSNPYKISTPLEFAFLGALMTARGNSVTSSAPVYITGMYFALDADIDLQGKDWRPLTRTYYSQSGEVFFDGQGHKIKNAYVDGKTLYASQTNQTYHYSSVFGNWQNGEISNVVIENANVSGTLRASIVAVTNNSLVYAKFSNVTVVNSRVTSTSLSSGICDGAKEIKNCKLINSEVLLKDDRTTSDGQLTIYQTNRTPWAYGLGLSNNIYFENEYVKVTYKTLISGETYYTFDGTNYTKVVSPVQGDITTYYVKCVAIQSSKVNFVQEINNYRTITFTDGTRTINSYVAGIGRNWQGSSSLKVQNLQVENSDIGIDLTVKDQAEYALSTDTTVSSVKRYYSKSGDTYTQITGTALEGKSPVEQGWYEKALAQNYTGNRNYYKYIQQNAYVYGGYVADYTNTITTQIEINDIKIVNNNIYSKINYAPTSESSANILFGSQATAIGALSFGVTGAKAKSVQNITVDNCSIVSDNNYTQKSAIPIYAATSDTTVNASKRYFALEDGTYRLLSESETAGKNPKENGWYTDTYAQLTYTSETIGAIYGTVGSNHFDNIVVKNCNLTGNQTYKGVDENDMFTYNYARVYGIYRYNTNVYNKFTNCSLLNNNIENQCYVDSAINSKKTVKGSYIYATFNAIGTGLFENCNVNNNKIVSHAYRNEYEGQADHKRADTWAISEVFVSGIGATSAHSRNQVGAGYKACEFTNNIIETKQNEIAPAPNANTYINFVGWASENQALADKSAVVDSIDITDCKVQNITLTAETGRYVRISGLFTKLSRNMTDVALNISGCDVSNINTTVTTNKKYSNSSVISYGSLISDGVYSIGALNIASKDNGTTPSINFNNIATNFTGGSLYYATASYFTGQSWNGETSGDLVVADVKANNITLKTDDKYVDSVGGIAMSSSGGDGSTATNYEGKYYVKNCLLTNSTFEFISGSRTNFGGINYTGDSRYLNCYKTGETSVHEVSNCVVDNLKVYAASVAGANIDNPTATDFSNFAGGEKFIAGVDYSYSANSTMKNCSITNSSIFAVASSTNCYVSGLGFYDGDRAGTRTMEDNTISNTKCVSYGVTANENGVIYKNYYVHATAYATRVSQSTLKNIVSENNTFNAISTGSNAIASGILYNSSSAVASVGTVEDCYSLNNKVVANYLKGASNSTSFTSEAFGIAGRYVRTIKNCVSSGIVEAKSDTGVSAAFGIGVSFRGNDYNTNNARIADAVRNVVSVSIEGCYNFANVTALGADSYSSHAGGIGYSEKFDSCINYGTVSSNIAGGMMSGMYTSSVKVPLIITNCTNAGDIVRSTKGAGTYLGGLVGSYYNHYSGSKTDVYENGEYKSTRYNDLDTIKMVFENNAVTGEIFTETDASGNYISEYSMDSYIGMLFGRLYINGSYTVYREDDGTKTTVSSRNLTADDFGMNTAEYQQLCSAYSFKNNYVLVNSTTNSVFTTISKSYTDGSAVEYEYQKTIPGAVFSKYGVFYGINTTDLNALNRYDTYFDGKGEQKYYKDVYNSSLSSRNNISFAFKNFVNTAFVFDKQTPTDGNTTVTATEFNDASNPFAVSKAPSNYAGADAADGNGGHITYKKFMFKNGTAPQVNTELKKQIILFDTNGVDADMPTILVSDVNADTNTLSFTVPTVEKYNKIGYTIDGWMNTATGSTADVTTGNAQISANTADGTEGADGVRKVVTLYAYKAAATFMITDTNGIKLNNDTANNTFAYGTVTADDVLLAKYTEGNSVSSVRWLIKQKTSDTYDSLVYELGTETGTDTKTYKYSLQSIINSTPDFFEKYAIYDAGQSRYELIFNVEFGTQTLLNVNVSYKDGSSTTTTEEPKNYLFTAVASGASIMQDSSAGKVAEDTQLDLKVTPNNHYTFNSYTIKFTQTYDNTGKVKFFTKSGDTYNEVATGSLTDTNFKAGNYYVNIAKTGEAKYVQIPAGTTTTSAEVEATITSPSFALNVENRSYEIEVDVQKTKYDVNINFQNLQGATISTASDSSFVKGNFVNEASIGKMSIGEALNKIEAKTNVSGYRFVGWKLGNMGENEYIPSENGIILDNQVLSDAEFNKYVVNDKFNIIAVFQRQFNVGVGLLNPISSEYASSYTITYVDENGETVSLTEGDLAENETVFLQNHVIDQNTLVEIAVTPNKKVKLANIETEQNIRYSGNFAYFYLTGNTDINFVFETKPLSVETSALVVTDPTSFNGTLERSLASAVSYGLKGDDGSINFNINSIPVDGTSQLALSSVTETLHNAEYRSVGVYLYNFKNGTYDLYDTENTILVDGDEFYDNYVTEDGSISVVMKAIKQYSAKLVSSGLNASDGVKDIKLGTYKVSILDEAGNVIGYVDEKGQLSAAMDGDVPVSGFNRIRIKTDADTGVKTILYDTGLKLKIDAQVLSKFADFVDTNNLFSAVDSQGRTSAIIEIDGSSNRSANFGFEKATYTIVSSYNSEVGGDMKVTDSFKLGDTIMLSYTPQGNFSITDWKIGGKTLEELGAVQEGNTITILATEEFMTAMANQQILMGDDLNFDSSIQTMISPTLLYGMIGGGTAIVLLFGTVLFLILRSRKMKKQKEEYEKQLNDMARKFGISDMIKDLKAGNSGLPNSPGMAKSAAGAAGSTSSLGSNDKLVKAAETPEIKTPPVTTSATSSAPSSGGIPGFNSSVQDAIKRASDNSNNNKSE